MKISRHLGVQTDRSNRAAIAPLLCSSVDAGDSFRPSPIQGDANMTTESTTSSQWVFPISALSCTPTAQERSLHEEMYDRSRGIEFLYRLGTSIGLFVRSTLPTPVSVRYAQPNPCLSLSHSPGLFTAATWFHRFFMRYSMLDYHRQVSLYRSCSRGLLIRH